MACKRYQGALSDLAAGGPASAEVEAHLHSCEACRAELRVLSRAIAVAETELRELLSAEPSSALPARIRQAVLEGNAPDGASPLAWLLPAAAVGLAALAAFAIFRSLDKGPRPAPQTAAGHSASEPPSATASAPEVRPRETQLPGAARDIPHNFLHDLPRTSRSRAASPLIEAEVLVPAGEREALLRFVADLQQRQVEPRSLLVADVTPPLTEPRGIEIPSLEISAVDSTLLDASGASGL